MFRLLYNHVMPFGLCNSSANFQNYVNNILWNALDKYATIYLNDVLIYSELRFDYRKHVRKIVKRFMNAGLQINVNKCEFNATKTKYLSLIIRPEGIEMDSEKVKAITTWNSPTSLKKLQKFLGFANFYRRFIRNFSLLFKPLHNLLKKDHPWIWQNEQKQSFQFLKRAFTTAPVLAMYDYDKKTVLETDASDWASGGILSQSGDDGVLRPMAYFSVKHTAAKCNYEIYDKKLLAIIEYLEKWRPELQNTAKPFEILIDYKNLEYFITTKALNQRQVRWSEFFAGFNFRITYKPGNKGVKPDALSRRSQDRPTKANPNDDRIKNRERRVLGPKVFDETIWAEFPDANNLTAAPAELILPNDATPLNELVNRAYGKSETAKMAIAALKDPAVRKWPKSIKHEINFVISDCRIYDNRIYYKNRLFVPANDELKMQIVY
jgi:hypothetical protein